MKAIVEIYNFLTGCSCVFPNVFFFLCLQDHIGDENDHIISCSLPAKTNKYQYWMGHILWSVHGAPQHPGKISSTRAFFIINNAKYERQSFISYYRRAAWNKTTSRRNYTEFRIVEREVHITRASKVNPIRVNTTIFLHDTTLQA